MRPDPLVSGGPRGKRSLSDPAITNVTQHYGDSATWDFSPVQGLDFVFIDGSHTYQYVRSDTIRCAEAAAGRATFVWHDFDYCHYDVVRYLTELASAGLPVRHIEMTNLVFLHYDRSLHLSKIQAAGDASFLASTPVGRRVELSRATG